MEAVKKAFEARAEETQQYIKVLERLDSEYVVLFDKRTKRQKRVFENDSRKVMKATVFLLLYNLVESSVRSAFEELYEAIHREGSPAMDLRLEFQKIWIRQKYRSFDKNSATNLKFIEITEELIADFSARTACKFRTDKMSVSGNLDQNAIKKICKEHGIDARVHRSALNGAELATVKNNRNHLAHGNVSFIDCGEQYTVSDLTRIMRQTVVFVRGVLKSMEKFIESKGFSAVSTGVSS